MQSAEIAFRKPSEGSLLSGVLLISGTTIGAGMLALPLITGESGFFPSLAVNILCWLFMTATGLLLLEATLWLPDGANILSMTRRLLGKSGWIIGGLSFVLLYYCLLVAYISGGTPILLNYFNSVSPYPLSGTTGYFLFASLVGGLIYFGNKAVDRVNWILMVSLILSYFLLITIGSTDVNPSYLMEGKWGLTLLAAPVLFSAYGYHNIVPSLVSYLERDVFKLRWSIILGTTLPFIVYTIWQWMILGTLTKEEISQAVAQGIPVAHSLQAATGHPFIGAVSGYFSFFALITSFLGVALSMVDFFADGWKIKSEGMNRFKLCALVFIPPAIFAALNPGIFLEALGIAGGFGEAILNGLIPIAMVWCGRYRLGLAGNHQVKGGRILLAVFFVFTLFIIFLEARHLMR